MWYMWCDTQKMDQPPDAQRLGLTDAVPGQEHERRREHGRDVDLTQIRQIGGRCCLALACSSSMRGGIPLALSMTQCLWR